MAGLKCPHFCRVSPFPKVCLVEYPKGVRKFCSAELWVTPKCWPDFDAGTLHQACRDFAARDRRFGGLTNLRGAV